MFVAQTFYYFQRACFIVDGWATFRSGIANANTLCEWLAAGVKKRPGLGYMHACAWLPVTNMDVANQTHTPSRYFQTEHAQSLLVPASCTLAQQGGSWAFTKQ